MVAKNRFDRRTATTPQKRLPVGGNQAIQRMLVAVRETLKVDSTSTAPDEKANFSKP